MELTDHQTHLKSVTEQAQGIVKEIQDLEAQAKNKRDLLLKLQGIIEYLQQTGVELPKEAPALVLIVRVVNGFTFVVARTTQKKLAPDTGADAKFILSSTIVNAVIAS